MEIILGKTAGFCFGVKTAVEEAKKQIKENEEICCLGEIVHNKNVIKDLESIGIKFIKNVEEAKGTVIIRAHGATKDTYKKIEQMDLKIKDLTCPKVLKIHKIAEEYSKDGFFIILIGIKEHPEAVATISFCGENSYILQEKDEIEQAVEIIKKSKISNILIVAQTTYNSKKFDDIAQILKNKLVDKNVVIQKTICNATEIRQKETIEISKQVDMMIIIGDKKSSNTSKLYDISKEYCKKGIWVENADELDLEQLDGINKVGIMAGASTPKEDIEKIIIKVKSKG